LVTLICMGFSMSFGIGHRNSCLPSKDPLPGRVDTSRQLRQLRSRLKAMALDAFIITRDDEHQVSHWVSNFHHECVCAWFFFEGSWILLLIPLNVWNPNVYQTFLFTSST
jgi:hypothetical protein